MGNWLKSARIQKSNNSENETNSFDVLVATTLEKPKYFGLAHPEYELSSREEKLLNLNLNRLLSGEPLPYIIGKQEFFGLDFFVTSSVLIPRPETELLVTTALDWLREKNQYYFALDIGSGSGCIAISIAKHYSKINFIAIDQSYSALEVAKKNISFYRLEDRIMLLQADLIEVLYTSFDCIFANLPYIPTELYQGLDVSRFEPGFALDGGPDGLRTISRLITQSKKIIKGQGFILIEIESDQKKKIIKLSQTSYPGSSIKVINDLADRPRLLCISFG